MLGWMAYVLVVGALLAGAALAAERAARLRRAPTRWGWIAAILASLVLPSVMASVSVEPPHLNAMSAPATHGRPFALRAMTSNLVRPGDWIIAVGGPASASPSLDAVLGRAWAAGSVVLALGVIVTGLQLNRRRLAWTHERVAGRTVLVSEDVGPAVVGLLRPGIVLPRWVMSAAPEVQEMVMAHEQSHLDAGDARLLALAIVLVIAMPWNLPLWWQLRRLRFAIEVDCDARVLRAGRDIRSYGRALLVVGERQSARVAVVAGMAESQSFLEQRMHIMVLKRTRFAWAGAAGLAALGAVLTASAAEVSPPDASPAGSEAAADPALLGAAPGYYLTQNDVITIGREGDRLTLATMDQPAKPMLAEASNSFYFAPTGPHFGFEEGPGGAVTGLVDRLGPTATVFPRVDAATAQATLARIRARVKSQAQNPGTETAMLRLEASLAAGKVDFATMTPLTASIARPQAAIFQGPMARHGAVKAVKFLGVSAHGEDVYDVYHENGVVHWSIALDPDGKIASIDIKDGP